MSVDFTGRAIITGGMIDTSKFMTNNKADMTYINESGDKMNGILDMNNHKILNVSNPEDDGDCCNKRFIENIIYNITKTIGILEEKWKQINKTLDNLTSLRLSTFQLIEGKVPFKYDRKALVVVALFKTMKEYNPAQKWVEKKDVFSYDDEGRPFCNFPMHFYTGDFKLLVYNFLKNTKFFV